MSDLKDTIVQFLKSERYRPLKPRNLAREMQLTDDNHYQEFKAALQDLIQQGTVVFSKGREVGLPPAQVHRRTEIAPSTPSTADAVKLPAGIVIGAYRHNKRGFGFVVPTNPPGHEDLFIREGENAGAINGDVVRAKITGSDRREGKERYEGRVIEIIERTKTRFVGSLVKQHGQWVVLPDGNDFTDPILAPDAASRHIKIGTKVVIELTQYPTDGQRAQGVITEVLGESGERDVDLRSVLVQHNLPEDFPEECKTQARAALDRFNATLDHEIQQRLDLTGDMICTIDPDDAKDYDDAISLRRLDNGNWQLGVHIADVSFFVEPGSPLDVEARERGNSAYFPGHVVPMLPEILSNGVCSLQERVPRLCKSAFIELDQHAKPVGTKFVNTVIRSVQRLRYREAQAILDGAAAITHPDGPKTIADYPAEVVQLLHDMDRLARQIQKRRHAAGQLVLGLPEVHLVLDEEGKVIGAVPEDESYTHTIIEMFMVEANEAVARVLDRLDVPFLRRAHPEPEPEAGEKLRQFVQVAGHRLPKEVDRKALQSLLESVKGKPESFAVNLAVLKSLTRAEYSPKSIGHYALASRHYCHFTSPIRRYADLTIHRLLDAYFAARKLTGETAADHLKLKDVPDAQQLYDLGKHLSFTERRADEAENELRKIKILELLSTRIGDEFHGVVTGITKFGIFIQLQEYLADGLIRYEDLMDDYWQVDERAGIVRGRRTGKRIGVGDTCDVIIVKVDVPRRELSLAITQLKGRARKIDQHEIPPESTPRRPARATATSAQRDSNAPKRRPAGPAKRNLRSKSRDRRKSG